MNYAKKALSGAVSVLLVSVGAAFLGYLIRLVLARNLTQSEYGMFYAVFALFSFVSIFKSLGLNQAPSRFMPEYLHKKDYFTIKKIIIYCFSIQFMFSFLLAAIAIIFSDEIALYYLHTPSASLVIKLLAVMFLFIPLENIFRFSFQGFQRMFHYAGVEFMRMLSVLIFAVVLFMKGFGIKAPSYAYIISYTAIPLLWIPSFIKTFPQFFRVSVKKYIDKELFLKLVKFGFPVMIGIFGATLLLYTDTILLGYFRTLDDVALYQVASPTSRLLLYFGYAVAAVFLPLSSELWAKKKKEKLRTGIELVYRYSFIIVVPAVLLVLSFPELMLKILFGKEYIPAAFVLQILSVGIIFYTIGHINGNILSGIGRPKENTEIVLFAAVLNLILNLIMIPRHGITGAAIATLISYIVILSMTSYKMVKHIKIKVPWSAWLKNTAAGIVFVAVIALLKRLLETNVWLEAVISVGAASLIYLALVFFLKLITAEDISFFRYAVSRKPDKKTL